MRNEPSAESTRLLPRVYASLAGHLVLVLLLFFWPSSAPPALPASVTVDLLSALPAAPAPPPAAAAKPTPAPKPAAPPPPPPKPKPVQKQVVLPKNAPEVKPKPKAPPVAKPVKRPARIERPQREKVEELEYDDALDLLRKELGEDRPPDELSSDRPPEAAKSGSQLVSPEMAAWLSDTRRHVRSHWRTPPEFLDRGFSTQLSVELAADGRVVGTPKVVRSSGDPFADDNAVRAILSASPLPAPPRAGKLTFVFTPEEGF